MDSIEKDIKLGVMRRRNEQLMLQHIQLLQDCVERCVEEQTALNARMAQMERDLAALTAIIADWRTERRVIIGSLKWIGDHARLLSALLLSLLTLFYDRIADAARSLIALLSER